MASNTWNGQKDMKWLYLKQLETHQMIKKAWNGQKDMKLLQTHEMKREMDRMNYGGKISI